MFAPAGSDGVGMLAESYAATPGGTTEPMSPWLSKNAQRFTLRLGQFCLECKGRRLLKSNPENKRSAFFFSHYFANLHFLSFVHARFGEQTIVPKLNCQSRPREMVRMAYSELRAPMK